MEYKLYCRGKAQNPGLVIEPEVIHTQSNQTISAASLGACLLTVHTAQDLWLQANFAMSFQLSDESIFA